MGLRGIPFDKLMSHSLEDIQAHFPFGARLVGKDKWTPADDPESATKTLKELVKAKEKRLEPPRLLHRDSSHGYTDFPGRAMPREPEAVDRDSQERFSREGRANFAVLHAEEEAQREVRSMLASLRQVGKEAARMGADPVVAMAMAANRALEDRERRAA